MTIFIVLIFFLIALSIIFFANYFFYFTLVKFFRISGPRSKKLIAGGAFLLSLSFIAASTLARYHDHFLVQWYYGLSAVWIGALLYLVIGCGLAWAVYGLAKKAGLTLNRSVIMTAILSLVLITVLYGVLNAGQVRIRQIDVAISGLPESWQDKAVVHISDVHLGVIHGAGYIAALVERINGIGPEAVFITGDYYDGSCACFYELAEPLSELEAGQGVYFVTGNHETYTQLDTIIDALTMAGVRVLRDEIIEIDGLEIIGADYPTEGMSRDMGELLSRVSPDKPNIFLYHEPRYIGAVRDSGVNLFLTGHTHAGQLWPINFIHRLIYGPYYRGLNQEGGFAVYTTSGASTWGPPLRVGSRSEIAVIYLR